MDEHAYVAIGAAVREVNGVGEKAAVPDKKLKRLIPGGGKQGRKRAPSPAMAAISEHIGIDYAALQLACDELAGEHAKQLFRTLDGTPGEGFVALSWELAAATFRSVNELMFMYGAAWALNEALERIEKMKAEEQ
jgi:hypothetical protein